MRDEPGVGQAGWRLSDGLGGGGSGRGGWDRWRLVGEKKEKKKKEKKMML